MKLTIALVAVLGIALGVAAIVYGGYDDAPGAQLIGVGLIVATVVFAVRTVRRGRKPV